MRRIFLFSVVLFFLVPHFFAATVVDCEQVVLPHRIFVGDTAEFRCSFSSSAEFLSVSVNSRLELPSSAFVSAPDPSSVTIKEVRFRCTAPGHYQLVFIFVPWRTGSLVLPEYSLTSAFSGVSPSVPDRYIIRPDPVEILSLIGQDGFSGGLRDTAAPLLVPGTMYGIYAAVFVAVLAAVLAVVLFLNRKSLSACMDVFRTRMMNSRNRRRTLRAVARLEKKTDITDAEFALEMQHIIRNYLGKKFGSPFSGAAAPEITVRIRECYGGILPDEKAAAAAEIESVFVRTDYILYAHGSVQAESVPAKFSPDGRHSVADSVRKGISAMEEENA